MMVPSRGKNTNRWILRLVLLGMWLCRSHGRVGANLGGPLSAFLSNPGAPPKLPSTVVCRGGADRRTGWNHNQPDENPEPPNGAPRNPNRSNEQQPRTGWLHFNTQSTTKADDNKNNKSVSQARQRLEQAMRDEEQNHRIISPPAFHACGEGRPMVVTEHMVSVPLQYDTTAVQGRAPGMDVYFSVVERVTDQNRVWLQQLASLPPRQRAQQYVRNLGLKDADDMILYLQGGPGFGSPTPIASLGLAAASSWAAAALDHYKRIVLMDQRGTGRSTTITKQTLQVKYPDLFLLDAQPPTTSKSLVDFQSSHPEQTAKVERAVQEATEYLTQFRADNIVRDAEEIKNVLLVATTGEPVTEPRPWGGVLGQSYGGFCTMSYLSLIPVPPRICLLTGGIAPMLTPMDQVYASLWNRVRQRNGRYYQMYPGDVQVVKKIVRKLLKQPAPLPSGGTLTARRFLQLGLDFGGSPSTFAGFHAKLSTALISTSDGTDSEFTRAFLKSMDSAQSFDDHPIYFWLHESIYANGKGNSPTAWAAHRAYEKIVQDHREYDYRHTSSMDDDSQPTLFFGEMVFPWMPEDFEELSGVGMRAVADAIASKTDWGPLYDGDKMRKVLSDGTSRAAAAVYFEDMYVDFDASVKVTAQGAPLENCKVWITNEYQHSGLRDSGASIFSKLYGMATGEIRTPS